MTPLELVNFCGRQDLHTHTTFCDGKNTPEEMVRAAIDRGLRRIGFSGHAPMCFDTDWCMTPEGVAQYRAEIEALRHEYGSQIDILCGMEQDLYAAPLTYSWDYIIGSVHYIKVGEQYAAVDESADVLASACREWFDGDYIAMAEHYFRSVEALADLKPTVIGHIDLIAKFNRNGTLFDENDERYLAAAYRAVDALLPTGAVFEINTGAIARGYRQEPYPAKPILDYIKNRGGRLMLTGDAHSMGMLCYAFEQWQHLLQGRKGNRA